jgi:hypothetical protein
MRIATYNNQEIRKRINEFWNLETILPSVEDVFYGELIALLFSKKIDYFILTHDGRIHIFFINMMHHMNG